MTNELRTVLKAYRQLENFYTASKLGTDWYLAATTMFENMTYRLLSTSSKDRLIGFRMIYRLFRLMGKRNNNLIIELDADSNAIIIGGGLKNAETVIPYIKSSSNATIKAYLEKDALLQSSLISRADVLAFMPFAFKQAVRCLFNWRRINIALTIHELLEISIVLRYVRQHKINRAYDFFPYEVDSNFLTLVLRDEGVHMTKNPSPGPLATHNRITIADTITLSTPYQIDELQRFSETIRVKNYLLWPPERAFLYQKRYEQHLPTQKFTIGFYSHGQWLRSSMAHSLSSVREVDGEPEILDFIKRFLDEMPHFKLVIFPHPRERAQENLRRLQSYYKSKLGNSNYELITDKTQTMLSLERVDIAIVLYSTVIYERLYCGYKTLIGNSAVKSFPMNRSPLNNICFQTYDEMKGKILEFAEQDEDYFFTKTNLEAYKFTNYPALKDSIPTSVVDN